MIDVGPIEYGVPMSMSGRGNGLLRKRMTELPVGASFATGYSRQAAVSMARRIGIKVETRKVGGGKIRVWRVG